MIQFNSSAHLRSAGSRASIFAKQSGDTEQERLAGYIRPEVAVDRLPQKEDRVVSFPQDRTVGDPTMAIAIGALTAGMRVAAVGNLLIRGMNKHALSIAHGLEAEVKAHLAIFQNSYQCRTSKNLPTPTMIYRGDDFRLAIEKALKAQNWKSSGDQEQIIAYWRYAAAAGIRLMDEIRHEFGRKLDPAFSAMIPTVTAALLALRDETFASKPSAVDRNSSANQRRWRRYASNIAAVMLLRDKQIRVVVADISQGGMGLMNAVGVHEHDRVIVKLPSGRQLAGIISWSQELQAGLRFETPLESNDPLLALDEPLGN